MQLLIKNRLTYTFKEERQLTGNGKIFNSAFPLIED